MIKISQWSALLPTETTTKVIFDIEEMLPVWSEVIGFKCRSHYIFCLYLFWNSYHCQTDKESKQLKASKYSTNFWGKQTRTGKKCCGNYDLSCSQVLHRSQRNFDPRLNATQKVYSLCKLDSRQTESEQCFLVRFSFPVQLFKFSKCILIRITHKTDKCASVSISRINILLKVTFQIGNPH